MPVTGQILELWDQRHGASRRGTASELLQVKLEPGLVQCYRSYIEICHSCCCSFRLNLVHSARRRQILELWYQSHGDSSREVVSELLEVELEPGLVQCY